MLCNIKNLWTSNPWVIFSQKKIYSQKTKQKKLQKWSHVYKIRFLQNFNFITFF